MDIFIPILAFVFGVIIGSFLNVVSLRFNTGSTLGGRSKCMSCGKSLVWYELIPILSYVFQRGQCTKCHSRISMQYPLVETATGLLFMLTIFQHPPVDVVHGVQTLFYLVIASLLVVITIYDIKHKIIPDRFVFSFSGIAAVMMFVGGESLLHLPSISQAIAGPLLAMPFALIWVFSRGKWMGLGDSKLILGIGWILGLSAGANAIILAFWIAAVISITYLVVRYRTIRAKTEIPFGPYLIIGMYIVLFTGVRVIDFSIVKDILLSFWS
jgi:prepilin signal peptidase PulO-like enzyme (type II secretory pathway)